MKTLFLFLSFVFCHIALADNAPPSAETVFQLEAKRYDPKDRKSVV